MSNASTLLHWTMSFLSFAFLSRNALGIPDTRIPVDSVAIVSYILPPVVCYFVAALLAVTPQTRTARVALWPLILLLAIRAVFSLDMSHGRFERKVLDLNFSMIMVSVVARSLEWALEKGPQRRISRHSKSSPSALKDALGLALNYRGYGWEWSRGLYTPPERRPTNRAAFLVSTLISAVVHTLLSSASHRALLTFLPAGVGSNPAFSTIFDETLPFLIRYLRSSLISTLTAFTIYAGVQMTYDWGTILAILILRQDPADWPPLFQAPWLATSVSDFWARRWHQYLRGTFLLLSRPLSLMFGRAGLVLGTFLISGALHHMTMAVVNPRIECGWMLVGFGMMGPGVLAENAFYRLTGRRVGGVFGWMWAMSWLLLWGHVLVEGFARGGLFASMGTLDSVLPVRIPVEHAVRAFDRWLHTIS